jgi:macrolide-specific efflux system membrane fusion protein
MKKFGIIIIIVLLTGALFYWRTKKSSEKNGDKIQKVQVQEGPIEKSVETTGEVAPLNRVEIKPPIQGRIEEILVEEGSKVKAGQILAWLSSSDRAAILDAARAKGEAEFKRWEDTYKPTPVLAPLSGVVILKNVVVGQTVDSATVLFAMSDKLIVLAHVDEVDIARVKLNMPARITLDSYPDQTVQGKVIHILYEGKNVSNVITYGVKVEPHSPPPYFRSQMTANIKLVMESKNHALFVPTSAVKQTGDGNTYVLIPGPDGKPQQKSIECGIETGDTTEILEGLKSGDTVLIIKKRYQPQQDESSNPLVMRRRNQNQNQSTGATSKKRG